MPPKGGFPNINFEMRLPVRGPHGAWVWAGVIGSFLGGMFILLRTKDQIRQEQMLKSHMQLAMAHKLDELLAEARSEHRKHYLDWEAKTMKNVEGWKVGESVYNHTPVETYFK